MECHDAENVLGLYVEGGLSDTQSAKVRAHLEGCGDCALLLLDMESTIVLCKSFPEVEPPPRLIQRVLQETIGPRRSLSWVEYLQVLFRPLYASPRFATGACLAAVSFSIVMNAFGVNLDEIRWSEITPRTVVDGLNRTANVAYDTGMRRLNGLKILYQIQSKIEEMGIDGSQTERPEVDSKTKERSEENSATEHRTVLRARVWSPVKV